MKIERQRTARGVWIVALRCNRGGLGIALAGFGWCVRAGRLSL